MHNWVFELLKGHKKFIWIAAINNYGYISKAVGSHNLLGY